MKNKQVRRLDNCYSSPYGRIHNPNITTKPKVYMGDGVPLNSVCAGHMVIGEAVLDVQEAKRQLAEQIEQSQIENSLIQEQSGPVLTKKLALPKSR